MKWSLLLFHFALFTVAAPFLTCLLVVLSPATFAPRVSSGSHLFISLLAVPYGLPATLPAASLAGIIFYLLVFRSRHLHGFPEARSFITVAAFVLVGACLGALAAQLLLRHLGFIPDAISRFTTAATVVGGLVGVSDYIIWRRFHSQ